MVDVIQAPPYLTVQDGGRPGYRGQGVPAGGAMDLWALAIANLLVGNEPGAAALEWALGSGHIGCTAPVALALAGASIDATLDGAPMAPYRTYRVTAGAELVVQRITSGRFAYIGVAGGIATPPVLGSRSTYLRGRFGGLDGRLLRRGDRLPVERPHAPAPANGFTVPRELQPQYTLGEMRVIAGPHAALFAPDAWSLLAQSAYSVASASDRMGYRLAGPILTHRGDAALPSEPVCAGAIQVPSGGQAIVLMADAPTVGGYPVIGTVCSADLPALAQRAPGERVQFRAVTIDEAQRAHRRRAAALHTIEHLARAASA